MKKLLLLLLTTALFFNCGSSGDDDTTDIGDVDISDDVATLIIDGESYVFDFIQDAEADNYKLFSCYDAADTSVSLSVNFGYVENSDTEIEYLSIYFSTDGEVGYRATIDEGESTEGLIFTVLEDSDTRFKINFSGVFKNFLNPDTEPGLDITEGVINIEL